MTDWHDLISRSIDAAERECMSVIDDVPYHLVRQLASRIAASALDTRDPKTMGLALRLMPHLGMDETLLYDGLRLLYREALKRGSDGT